MNKYLIQITENINHQYEVEAEDEDGALDAYDRLTEEQLKTRDLDGDRSWDRPWDVSKVTA